MNRSRSESITRTSAQIQVPEVWSTAIGLMCLRPTFHGLVFLALATTGAAEALADPWTGKAILSARCLERLVALSSMWVVGSSTVRLLKFERCASSSKEFLAFFCFGLIGWLVAGMPTGLLPSNQLLFIASSGLSALSLAVLSGIIFGYYLFFWNWFLLCAPGSASVVWQLRLALRLVWERPTIPLLLTVGPWALAFCLRGAFDAPAPDGSVAWLTACRGAADSVSVYFSMFGALAYFALHQASCTDQRTPYLRERLDTLRARGGGMVSKLLDWRVGLQLIAIGALIAMANLARLSTLSPAAEFREITSSVASKVARVELTAQDHLYNFRGFRPIDFRVHIPGTSSGRSDFGIRAAWVDDIQIENVAAFPHDEPTRRLALEFDAPPVAAAELFYRSTKVADLVFEGTGK